MLLRSLCTGLITLSLASLVGCGEGDVHQETRYRVTGTVTLDGTPLEQGNIMFVSEEDVQQGRPPGSAPIENGKYEVQTTPGKKQVKIHSPREAGEPDATGMVPTVETIPDRYNVATELEVEVPEQQSSEFDFDLKS